MSLPFVRPKRTIRTVVNLEDAAGNTLTVPLGVLRQVVSDSREFGDTASAEFHVVSHTDSYGHRRLSALRSLTIEEER